MEWLKDQYKINGQVPTNLVRREVSRLKGKPLGSKTWQTWSQDFRRFFPDVELNSNNEWTSPEWIDEEKEESENEQSVDELDEVLNEMFGESEIQHSTDSENESESSVCPVFWDGIDDEKQPEM